jgi:predicted ATPase
MRPLAVLIGANGAGKTSLLEAWSLLAASAEGRLLTKISELNGFNEILTRGQTDRMTFDVSWSEFEQYQLDYHLLLEPSLNSYRVAEEQLFRIDHLDGLPREPLKKLDLHLQPSDRTGDGRRGSLGFDLETELSQARGHEPGSFRRNLSSCASYPVLDVGSRAPIRLPQAIMPATSPGVRGEDLISFLYNLRETDHNRYEAFTDTVSAAFGDFERLDFPPVAAGMVAMTWKDKNFSRPFFMNQLSAGMLRFLWLAACLIGPNLPAVTLIDEPEVSLHPELMMFLADLMRDASLRSQLIVATQSDMLIRFLEPQEVLVADVDEDGTSKLTWADSLDLEHWLADFSLDELHQMGRLGGRSR